MAGCSSGETAKAPDGIAVATKTPALAFRYVTWKVEPKSDFQRISEYFGGAEDTGGDTVVRTHPEERAGLYFITALEWSSRLPLGAVATIELVTTDRPEPQKYALLIPPVNRPAYLREIRLGITGADHPVGVKSTPVAWKITLRDPKSLEVLATAQSYLWSLDDGK